jgi:glucose dehydrogenase
VRARAKRHGLTLVSALIVAGTLVAIAVGASPGPRLTNWPLPNLNRASTRSPAASAINLQNVGALRVAWRFRFRNASVSNIEKAPETIRGVVSTPLVIGDTIYVQDSRSSVYAIDRTTGALRWKHAFRADNFGRNGISYSSGSLYASTDTTVFALSARSGRMLWQRFLVTPAEQFVDIAPLIANNLVYVATVGYAPGGRGAIYALDAHSGAVRWKFSTIHGRWAHPAVAGGGGAWYTPSVDPNGDVLVGVANPDPPGGTPAYPNGAAFAGRALYTDSLLVLSGRTGKLLWYDQVTPHDIRDYDFQLPPILATVSTNRGPLNLVIGAGKAGYVIAWDRSTHGRVWQSAVGRHLHDVGPLPAHRVTICPGFYGGVETPMAYAAGRVFVPVVDLCAWGSATSYEPIGALDPTTGRGEFLALNAADGRVLWKRSLPQPDFGCATSTAGVVFTSTFNGRVYAFSAATGQTLWRAREPAGINGCPSLSGKMLLVVAGSGTTRMRDPSYELVAYRVR